MKTCQVFFIANWRAGPPALKFRRIGMDILTGNKRDTKLVAVLFYELRDSKTGKKEKFFEVISKSQN